MAHVTATIIACNEEAAIGRAIRSLKGADELLVVDSGSADATCRIAEELGARVILHDWPGYAAQKNFAAEQAQNDWILSLDADEELDERAQQALLDWKSRARAENRSVGTPTAAGYRWPRRALYLQRWIRHSGWYPDPKIRLYDRRRGHWQGDYVHESVAVQGRVAMLPGEIRHYSFQTLAEHYDRIERYTDLAAREMAAQGRRTGAFDRWLAPPVTFLQTYFLKAGFLDGYAGFCIARAAAHYVARKYEKLSALRAGHG